MKTYRLYIAFVSLYLIVLLPITNHISFTHDHQLYEQSFSDVADVLDEDTASEHQHIFSIEFFFDRSVFAICQDKYLKISVLNFITQIIYTKPIYPPPKVLKPYF